MSVQEEMKSYHGVTEREVSKQRNLDRVRIRDPANRKRISQVRHSPTPGLVLSLCVSLYCMLV